MEVRILDDNSDERQSLKDKINIQKPEQNCLLLTDKKIGHEVLTVYTKFYFKRQKQKSLYSICGINAKGIT